MYFEATPEQQMLRDTARAFLEDKSPPAQVRRIAEAGAGFDPGTWKDMASLGWQGIAIPAAYGGAGLGFPELGVVMEELGRALVPAPFLSTVVLGANALLLAASEEQKQEILPAIAAGDRRVAVALGDDAPPGSADTTITGTTITGTGAFVLDGRTADLFIVVARSPQGTNGLYLVDAAAAGVEVTGLTTMDQTRPQARVAFDDVPILGRLDAIEADDAIARLLDVAAVMLAFEQVGGAQRCLEMSVEYAKERVQFGRPIGSFQAVKHKCADMLVEVEAARSAALYAGRALLEGGREARIAAALAKARCSDAYLSVAAETIQVHGGIGFSWDHDAHLYFKRAKTDEMLFGTPTHWRAILADHLDL